LLRSLRSVRRLPGLLSAHPHRASDLLIDIGCQGRGVGPQTRMGQALASYVHSGDRSVLPVAPTDIKAFPLYGLRRAYVAAAIDWYKMTDGGL